MAQPQVHGHPPARTAQHRGQRITASSRAPDSNHMEPYPAVGGTAERVGPEVPGAWAWVTSHLGLTSPPACLDAAPIPTF